LTVNGFSSPKPDTTKYDRDVRGRPFDVDEFFNKSADELISPKPGAAPGWVKDGAIKSDNYYFGIGKATESSDEADDEARLRFAQHVETKVQSIASQQIEENKDRLEENYSYEALVSTDMNLRSVSITERFITQDSIFYSLIRYGKSEYHDLVTQEIQISLEANIRKQTLAHQALEALRADSLRHKLTMDSLALGRKQAVIDSLDHILKMEESRQRQEQERLDLIKNQFAAFLEIQPRYQLIDVPTANIPQSIIHLSGRWNPDTQSIRQFKLGLSMWLFSAETNLWAQEAVINQGDLIVKLQVLPERGEIYPVSLALGWTGYLDDFAIENRVNLKEGDSLNYIWTHLNDEIDSPNSKGSSFFVSATVGIPQVNNHISLYADNRKVSLANIWYPFPRNMGDAISIINQIDVIQSEAYRNRWDDQLQWQLGLRLIAIPDRFATMISYEDHEVWMLNFEFQY